MSTIWIIFIGITLLSWIVQANLNRKFKKYSEIPVGGGMTGRDVAEKMLHTYGIYDVKVTCIEGRLTDLTTLPTIPSTSAVRSTSRVVWPLPLWPLTSVVMLCSMLRPMAP